MHESFNESLKHIWALLSIPLGWLWILTGRNAKELKEAKEELSNSRVHTAEKYVTKDSLKESIQPIKEDIKEIKQDIKTLISDRWHHHDGGG